MQTAASIGSRIGPGPAGALAGLLALALVAAGDPSVVRLRVPAARVGEWIGPGVERRGLGAAEFERLVATAASRRDDARPRARLIAAEHRARWVEGRLIGESRLTFQPGGAGPDWVVLDPWLATIDPDDAIPPVVLGLADGRTAVRVEGPARAEVRIDWRADPRPGSGGRLFALGFPDASPSVLALDLPAGLEPIGPPGLRLGPERADGVARWRFEGSAGASSLQLLGDDGSDGPAPPAAWGRSTTTVELDPSACHWRSDWRVDLAPAAPRALTFELDPRLEFVEAVGDQIEGVEARREEGRNTVTVRLGRAGRPDRAEAVRLALSAIAPPAGDGRWVVPWSRLNGASWTGSSTQVALAAGSALASCRELEGRRVADRGGPDALGRASITFESRAPGPVAELTFLDSTAEVVAEVRGELTIGPEPPRAVADLSWRAARGRLAELAFSIPPAWSVESIAGADGRELASWRAEPRGDGTTRVEVRSIATSEGRGSIRITARAVLARGEVPLPRFRPEGLPIEDERWTATIAPGLAIACEDASGLAWLDPDDDPVTGPAPDGDAGSDRPDRLAWRWVAPDGEGRARIARSDRSGTIRVDQQVELRDGALALRCWLDLPATGDGPTRLFLGLPAPVVDPPLWRDRSSDGRSRLRLRSLDEAEAAEHGLDPNGSSWELVVEPGAEGLVLLAGTLAIAGDGPVVPLLTVDGPWRVEGTAAVWSRRPEAIRARPVGNLRPLPTGADDFAGVLGGRGIEAITGDLGDDPPGDRRAEAAFRYAGRPGQIEVERQPLGPATAAGVIRRAMLVGDPVGIGPSRRSLRLEVVPIGAGELLITLPLAVEVADVRIDGREAPAWQRGRVVGVATGGSAPAVVEVDYVVPTGTTAEAWPEFSWPRASDAGASSFSGENSLDRVDSGATVPRSAFVGIDDPLFVAPRRLVAAGSGPTRGSVPVELEREVGTSASTVGELLAMVDRAGRPVLVDRSALAALGIGPGSRAARGGTVGGRLASLGLVAEARPTALIVTTRRSRDRAAGREPPQPDQAAERALIWGHDGRDRLATLSSWIDSAPATIPVRPALVDRDGPDDSPTGRPWLLDREPFRRSAVAVGVGIFLLSLPLRRVNGRWFAIGMVVAIGAAALVVGRGDPAAARIAGGAAWGLVLAGALRLGRSLREGRRSRARTPTPTGDRTRSTSSRTAGLAGALLLGLAAGLPRLDAAIDEFGPIVAFFPFEGDAPAGPIADDDPAVLRLDDYRRLVAAAGPAAEPAAERIGAIRVVHVVTRSEDVATIASRYSLWIDGDGAAEWPVPAIEGLDFAATLDGQAAPVRIAEDGRRAVVGVEGPGAHELEIRRDVPLRVVDDEESIAVHLGRSCLSRVEVVATDARRTETGPVDLSRLDDPAPTAADDPSTDPLEVRWSAADRRSAGDSGVAEGLVLWDSEPAGDRYRARWTWRGGGRRPVVRLAVDRGLQLRSATAEGSIVSTRRSGPVDRPVLILAIDPPLAEGQALELDLWAPRAVAEGPRAGSSPAARPIAASLPRIEPLDSGRVAGMVAFRRPGDWIGRIQAGGRLEPASEESFVAAWGTWPRDDLTLAGVARFTSPPVVELPSGPRAIRRVVRPTLQVDPRPGRLDWRLSAEIQELGGRAFEAEIGVDERLVILRVTGDGLSAWSRPAPGLLSLRFDRDPSLRRTIEVQGWIATAADPMAPRPSRSESELAWPSWPGFAVESPRLIVAGGAAGAPRLDGLAGRALPPAGLPGGLAGPGPDRTWYEFAPTAIGGRLSWSNDPGRLTAAIRSRLTVGPSSTEWSALVRLEIAGGPSEAIPLRIPAGWAEGLVAEVNGAACPITTEPGEAGTVVTLRPARRLWGSAVVRLTSERLRAQGDSIDFPALVPLGKGSFGATLELVDATGRGVGVIESTDLDRVEVRADDRGPQPLGPGRPSLAFAVRRPGWSLRLRVAPPTAAGGDPEPPRCTSVELLAVVDRDGSTWGLADCRLVGDAGDFLPIEADRGVELIAATVDGEPVRPRSGEGSRWEVPLPAGPADRLVVLWRGPGPAAGRSTGAIPLALPATGPVPTSLVVWADDSSAIFADRGPLAAAGAAAIWSQRLEAAALAIESPTTIAAGPAVDRTLVAQLDRLTADARRVARRLGPAGGSRLDRLGVALDRAGRILAGGGDLATIEGVALRPEPLSIPRIGRPHGFVGTTGGPAPRPTLSWRRVAVEGPDRLAVPRLWLGVALLLAPIVVAMVACRSRPIALSILAVALALVAWGAGLDPWLIAAALGLGLWGRFVRQ